MMQMGLEMKGGPLACYCGTLHTDTTGALGRAVTHRK